MATQSKTERDRVGLCLTCRHSEHVVSARAATYYLCRLSFTDPRFVKYPRLPVVFCEGYEDASGHVSV